MTAREAAERCLAGGLCVIPVRADGGKRPAVRWQQYQEARPDGADLDRWWPDGGPHGLAVVCGAVSGGLEVIDLDDRALLDEWRALVEAETTVLLPRLPLVRTPGGWHVYYRCPGAVAGNRKLAELSPGEAQERRGDRGKTTLAETRGEGGYVLAPGCPPACHPAGGTYEHVAGPPPWEAPEITAEDRELLLAAARLLHRAWEPAVAWDGPRQGGARRPGDDYEERVTWDDLLAPLGWECVRDDGRLRYWRRPGKSGRLWSATTGVRDSGRDLLHVFTSNAAPFQPSKTYSRFAAYALLNHGGDYKAAARALAAQGHGDRAGQRNGRTAAPAERNGHAAPVLPPPEPDPPEPATRPWPAPPAPEAYHGLAGDVVAAIEPETEADPAAVLVQFLAAFGNAAGREPYYSVGPRRHHANLYTVLVGRTAKARKGTAWSWVEGLLGGPDSDWLRDHVLSGLSSREGLIQAFTDLGTDKRLLAVEEEFAAVLRVASRDGNTISAALRQAWDSGHLRTVTRANPLRVRDCHFSLIGHITREELLACLGETDASNGLCNRVLWACARRSKLLPDGGSMVPMGTLQLQVRAALEHAGVVGRMTRAPEARDLWHAEYARLSAERPGLLGLVTNRAEAQVLRLSLVYALLDRSATVRVEHLRAALALWDYCDRSAAWVFGEDTGSRDADTLLDALRAAGEAGLSGTQISALFNRHRTAREIAEALGVLRDAGLAEMRPTPTAGRPVKRWYALGRREQSEHGEVSGAPTTYGDRPS